MKICVQIETTSGCLFIRLSDETIKKKNCTEILNLKTQFMVTMHKIMHKKWTVPLLLVRCKCILAILEFINFSNSPKPYTQL